MMDISSEDDSQESDYDVDSDVESVCSTVSSDSLQVVESSFKVFVKNIPPSVKSSDIKIHLQECGLSGNVKNIRIFRDKDKKPKGCGYIEVTPSNAGRRAISILNGSLLLGKHKIEAKKFHDRRRKRSPKHKSDADQPSKWRGRTTPLPATPQELGELCKVYVGPLKTKQLPQTIRTAHLQKHFKDFEPQIQNAFIVMDQKTEQSKGFGFVIFKSKHAAELAMSKLNGSRLHGCQLKLSPSTDQGKRHRNSSQSSSDSAHLAQKKETVSPTPLPISSCTTASSIVQESPLVGHTEASSLEFKVFVGGKGKPNLADGVQEHHIRTHFAQFQSAILNVYIPKNKRHGFVVFSSYAVAERAIEVLNGSTLHGCPIRVQFDKGMIKPFTPTGNSGSDPNPVATPQPCPPQYHPQPPLAPSTTICLSNLNPAIDKETITSLCGGTITDLQVSSVDANSKKAIVTFSSVSEAKEAIDEFNGKDFLGQTVFASYQPPAQPLATADSYMYPVKVTHLAVSVDEAALCALFREAGEIVACKVFQTNNRYALVSFKHDYEAKKAVDAFHSKVIDGMKINVSQKSPQIRKDDLPSNPQTGLQCTVQPLAVGSSYVYPVKVTHLAATVDEAALCALFKEVGEILECKVFQTNSRYALVNFKHDHEAKMAVDTFHGRVIDGMKINVSQKPPEVRKGHLPSNPQVYWSECQPVTVQVSNLNLHKQVHEHWKCLTEAFSSYQSSKVEDVCPPNAFIKFGSADEAHSAVEILHQSIIGGSTVQVTIKQAQMSQIPASPNVEQPAPDIQKVIQLTSARWNLLTAVNSVGSSLYQDLYQPFKANPNVKVELLPAELAVTFTGKQDAVDDAHNHFWTNLQRHIPIELEVVQALVEIHPNLPKVINEKFGVTLVGFHEGASLLKLDGSLTSIPQARNTIDDLIEHFQKSIVPTKVSFTPNLLISAKRRFKDDGIAACLSLGSPGGVTVYSFSADDHEKAVKIVGSKPSVKYVPFQPNPTLQDIPLDEFSTEHCVSVDEAEQKIYVRSYVRQDVLSVYEKIKTWISIKSVQFSPFDCTPEQILYLRCKLRCQYEATWQILDKLPAEVIIEPDRLPHFKGSPLDIESSQKQLTEGPLLEGLKHQSFSFKAHPKFFLQIEQHILVPAKKEHPDFEYVKTTPDEEPSVRKGRRGSTKGEESEFTITIFSQDSEVFDGIVSALEAVSPCLKTLSLPHSNALGQACLQEKKEFSEQQYRVRIVITKNSSRVLIFGLTENEAGQCLTDLREKIDSTVVIEKSIKLDRYQAKYLQQKRSEEWKDLQRECKAFKVFDHQRQEKDTVLIRVEGTVKQVKAIERGLAAMTGSDYFVRSFTVVIPKKYNRMWLKHWDSIIKEEEQSYDFIVEVSRKRSAEPVEEDSTVKYEFTICGSGDESASVEVEQELSELEIMQKIIHLSEKATRELDKGRKDKELHVTDQYIVDMFVDFKGSKVVLTTPAECSGDLEAAEAEIQRFIGNRALMQKEITVDDPVIGLILHSRSKSSPHIVLANQLSKPHGVSVECLRQPRCGLLLRGSQEAIVKVEPLICQKIIAQLESTIDEMKFPVDPALIPFFSTPDFIHFNAKIKSEFCVLSTFPKMKKNEVIKSVYLKTTSSASCIKLDVCKGNLTNEATCVDALVNAANEDLHHVGGLAQSILEEGGSTIQKESTAYVQANGKLKIGSVVPLGPGNLPCKKILHAVGPRWVDGAKGEEQTLYFTVLTCLQTCQREGLESVALPALSTGIFAVPGDVCIRASMKAVRDFCQISPNSCVTNVRFVLLQSELAKKFASGLDSDVLLNCTIPVPQAASSSATSTTWEWMDDDGSFKPYSPDLNSKLSNQYKQFPHGKFSFAVNKGSYTVDFSTMIQTNVLTNYQRRVRQSPNISLPSSAAQPSTAQWKFCNDDGRLTPYIPADSQAIESMFQSRAPGQLVIKGNVYGFDFHQMFQINIMTGYKRRIERTLSSTADVSSVDLPEKSSAVMRRTAVVTLRGPRANLQLVKSKLDSKLKGALKSGEIPFPISLERKIISIVQHHKLTFSFKTPDQADRKGATKRLTYQGLSDSVNNAISAIQEEIINYHTAAAEESAEETPPEWEPQTQTLKLCPVTSGSPEWNKVERNFKCTLPSVSVVQITRIQNKWLWERFALHKKRLAYKNDGNVNERELFHGTRSNDPKLIYEGEDGFDMRYCAQGMWGLANYFAVNASYSHSYAYPRSDGSREMFLVKVLTGDSFQCPSNSTLRMPPEKQGVGSGKLQLTKVRYDTVTGTTNGSQVFMTYDNDKAYPAYLIQYR